MPYPNVTKKKSPHVYPLSTPAVGVGVGGLAADWVDRMDAAGEVGLGGCSGVDRGSGGMGGLAAVRDEVGGTGIPGWWLIRGRLTRSSEGMGWVVREACEVGVVGEGFGDQHLGD